MSKLIKQGLRNIIIANVLGLAVLGLVVLIMALTGRTFTADHAESFLFVPIGTVIGTLLGAAFMRDV